MCLSLPTVICRGGVRETIPLARSAEEQEALRKSADTLKGVLRSVGL